jgi:hypothetical protein
MGRFFWREDGSVVYNCCWPSPTQSFSGPSPVGCVIIFYCLRLETYVITVNIWRNICWVAELGSALSFICLKDSLIYSAQSEACGANVRVFYSEELLAICPSWKTTPCQLYSIDYSPSSSYPPQAYPDIASSISDLRTSSSGDETDENILCI